jgi:hypothetical protein
VTDPITLWTLVRRGDMHVSVEGITEPSVSLCGTKQFDNKLAVTVIAKGSSPFRASCAVCAEKLYALISEGKVKVVLT